MLESTMQDFPLTITSLFKHGRRVHADAEVITWTGNGPFRATFAEVGERADRLAAALHRLGIEPGDRVGTFCWNNQHHLESYLAIPCMGAVLHTLNIRLFPEQLAYVINHAEDKVIIVDRSLIPMLAKVSNQLTTVRHVIVVGDTTSSGIGSSGIGSSGIGSSGISPSGIESSGDDTSMLAGRFGPVLDYEELLAAERPGYLYPAVDERSAAAMCYTSGTTGNPKGVVYSHRSTYLHSLGICSAQAMALSQYDRLLAIVPMFHANAWGMPYAGWWVGADMIMPQQFLQAGPLADIIEATGPTYSGAVPTVLNDLLANRPQADLSSLRQVVCGGSAVPRSLIEGFEETYGVDVVQAWGMTETSPLAAIAHVPKGTVTEEAMDWRARTGRAMPGVEIRICGEDGQELPWDGEAQGEIEIRGPWITGGYYRDPTEEKFHDGWLRTGDVGSIEANGFIQISDRAKDVIKSGGEWISSVDLENTLMGHPEVLEAAVVGIPDDRWDERPLACVVPVEGRSPDLGELRTYLAERVAKWWVPERWATIEEVPKTSVGKFDKKVLRRRFSDGDLDVSEL